jgi:quercetin dioxygenase-like cupin family protein
VEELKKSSDSQTNEVRELRKVLEEQRKGAAGKDVAGAVVGVGGLALAQHGHGDGKGPAVKTLSAVDIDEEVSGKKAKATTLEVTFAPGVASAPHRHPGPVFGYVLEGELELAIGDGKVTTLKAGDTFYEPAMALHTVSRNPSDKVTTRVLAVLIHPRDAKELVIPEPTKKGK